MLHARSPPNNLLDIRHRWMTDSCEVTTVARRRSVDEVASYVCWLRKSVQVDEIDFFPTPFPIKMKEFRRRGRMQGTCAKTWREKNKQMMVIVIRSRIKLNDSIPDRVARFSKHERHVHEHEQVRHDQHPSVFSSFYGQTVLHGPLRHVRNLRG